MFAFSILKRQNRILLSELVVTDFKLRYQDSALGYLWSLLRPLFIFTILYIVFGKFLKLGGSIDNFPIYLLLGIVLWGYFTEATGNGLKSIVDRGDLIRKVNFPKYIIVISGTISALINLLINMVVVLVFCLIAGIEFRSNVVFLPLVLLQLYIFSVAMAFLLSALYVKFRDVGYLWEVLTQAAFYATPILYPLSFVIDNANATIAKIMMISPAADIIQNARESLITPDTMTMSDLTSNPLLIALPTLIIVIIAVFASLYFRSNSKYFAERI